MEIERNWICKRLIREIIIKREVSESFETFDRDENDSLHEGIKKKKICNMYPLLNIFLRFVDVYKRIYVFQINFKWEL